MLIRILLAAVLMTTVSGPAFAHLNPGEHGSFMAGLSHPAFGIDHVLVMVAVGLWAAMMGGRARWGVPAAFVASMTMGFGLALVGVGLPFVEPAILASVVALGLLIALAVRVPFAIGAVVVSVFAVFHGHAHGAEIGAAGIAAYGSGFVVATALLHGAGIALGTALQRLATHVPAAAWMPRALGAATAVGGVALIAL